MSHPARISAVINTLNEENNIRWCLESVRGWCDEIVVVDMYSDDRTREIAAEYGASVHLHPRIPDFDRARQFAVEQALGEWVLLVDADEMIPISLAQQLCRIAKENEVDAVSIPMKAYLLGEWIRHTGWWPDYHIRFFRRTAMTFPGKAHASISVQPGCRLVHLPAREEQAMVHFNYRDTAHFVEKLNRYTSLQAQELFEASRQASALSIFLEFGRGFAGRYVKWKGYRDRMHGLVLSLLMGVYRMLIQIKLWEMQHELTAPAVEKHYDEVRRAVLNDFESTGFTPPLYTR